MKKLNNVNYSSLSNDINIHQINYLPKINNISNHFVSSNSIYNSPIRKQYITLSQDSNSNFYNSPQVSPSKKDYLLTENNINYYNSPQRTNKFINYSSTNDNPNIIF